MNEIVDIRNLFTYRKMNYKYSLRITKVRVIRDLMRGLVNLKDIKYLRLRATCRYSKKHASDAYDVLCDLWDMMEQLGMQECMKIVESEEPINENSLYCYGHEVNIRNGKISIVQWLI